MSNNSHNPQKIRLSDEQRKSLQALDVDIAEAENVIAEMEAFGVDFGNVKAQLQQAKLTRERLLKVF